MLTTPTMSATRCEATSAARMIFERGSPADWMSSASPFASAPRCIAVMSRTAIAAASTIIHAPVSQVVNWPMVPGLGKMPYIARVPMLSRIPSTSPSRSARVG